MDEKKPEELNIKKQLASSDSDLIRVLEDLIDILIKNGTIRMTDLPPKALEKLSARKQVRKNLHNSLNLINDDEDSII